MQVRQYNLTIKANVWKMNLKIAYFYFKRNLRRLKNKM